MDQEFTVDPQASSLDLLPLELVNLISSKLDGISNIALYLCGNKIFNKKLTSHRGCTHFSVVNRLDVYPPHFDWRNQNFIAICKFRNLVSLEFRGFSQYAFRYFGYEIISSLPPTLKTIYFDFIESFNLWVTPELDPVTGGIKVSDKFEAFDLGKQLPALTSLRLYSRFWDRFSIYRNKKLLHAYTWTVEHKVAFCAKLPRSLTHLSLSTAGFEGDVTKYIEHLDNLETLELDCSYSFGQLESPLWAHLPHKLQALKLTGTLAWQKSLLDFPSHVKHVDIQRIQNMEYDQVAEISRHLLTLKISVAPQITHQTIAKLPPRLTHLQIGEISNLSGANWMADLPRTLVTLELGLPNKLIPTGANDQGFYDLPQSLTKFAYYTEDPLPASCLELLPSNLKEFSVYRFDNVELPDGADVKEDQDAQVSNEERVRQYWLTRGPVGCILKFCDWRLHVPQRESRPIHPTLLNPIQDDQ